MSRRLLAFWIVSLVITFVFPLHLIAADFPEKPITLIMPQPPGGAPDIVGRALAEAVKPHLSQPVVVVNRPGAAGSIGTAEVIRAKPDGYTVGFCANANLTIQPLRSSLPYNSPDDYQPLMKLVSLSSIFAVQNEAPWKNAKELLDYGRKNPEKLRGGIPGLGTVTHFELVQLSRSARVDFTIVPYETGQQIPALIGGHLDFALGGTAAFLPQVKAGKLRVIGVFQKERNPVFPDAVTFQEIGHNVAIGVNYLLILPKGTLPAVVSTLNEAFKKAVVEPSFVELMQKNQFDIDYAGPEALSKELSNSYKENGKLIESLGLKDK